MVAYQISDRKLPPMQKTFIAIVISFILVAFLQATVVSGNSKTPQVDKPSEVEQASEKPTTPIEEQKVTEAKSEEKVITWQDNPSGCDIGPTGTQVVWASETPDFPCHDKPVVTPTVTANASQSVSVAQTGDCDLVYNYDWPQATAKRICLCESGGNSNAIGDNYPINGLYAPSVGLMQIRLLDGRPSKAWLLNAKNNMDYAYNMWKSQGFGPWSCY